MQIDRRLFAQFDWVLLALSLSIPCVGLVVLYSAGYDPDAPPIFSWIPASIPSPTFVKQVGFILIGILVMVIGMLVPLGTVYRYSYLFYFLGVVSLVAVLKLGFSSHGSTRWLSLGFVNVQPAEIMKFAVVLALGRFLSKSPPPFRKYGRIEILLLPFLLAWVCWEWVWGLAEIDTFYKVLALGLVLGLFFVALRAEPTRSGYGLNGFFPFLVIIGLPMGLIIAQPDLGTALTVGAGGVLMILFMGVRWHSLLVLVFILVAVIKPAYDHLHPYQQARVRVLFDTSADPSDEGYQLAQSKIAIGSGQLTGKGFLKGTQTQLEFVPENTTDFIFAVLAEEWGFIGAILVLALYLSLITRILYVSARSRELFPALVAFGIAGLFFFHSVVNIGMVIGILPVVGLPLPLFSYGGSSTLSAMFMLGVVQGIAVRRFSFVTPRAG